MEDVGNDKGFALGMMSGEWTKPCRGAIASRYIAPSGLCRFIRLSPRALPLGCHIATFQGVGAMCHPTSLLAVAQSMLDQVL
jgi:hypothetical protein